MDKLTLLFCLLATVCQGQYFKIGIADNSIPDEYKSTWGQFYEIGYSRQSVFWGIDYGIRYDRSDFGQIPADYLSLLLAPRFYVSSNDPLKMILGGSFRIGGNMKKDSRATYLQSWTSLFAGIHFWKVELTAGYEVSLRSGIYRGSKPQKLGLFALRYTLF